MSFAQYSTQQRLPRDEHVDIVVRRVSLNPDAPDDDKRECIEIREFIKESEVFGHGILIPASVFKDVLLAGERVLTK